MVGLSAYLKAMSHYIAFNGSSMLIIDQTTFTEFGGELGNHQRPTLERIDMKLGKFN